MNLILIIGGAYQGKLDYAYQNYGKGQTVFQCSDMVSELDFSKDIINSFHFFVFAQIKNNIDSLKFLCDNLYLLENKIIICDDISCGVVPTDLQLRIWRESVGRCSAILAGRADRVIRVFCGIGMILK